MRQDGWIPGCWMQCLIHPSPAKKSQRLHLDVQLLKDYVTVALFFSFLFSFPCSSLFLPLLFSLLFSLASLWLFPLFFSHKHRQRERHRERHTHTHTPTGYVAVCVCVCVCMWALIWRFKCRGLSGSQQQVISH